MRLQDMRVSLSNINGKGIPEDCADCTGVGLQTDKGSDVVKAYSLTCIGAKGSSYIIKIPVTDQNEYSFDLIQKSLRKEEIVRITPEGIVITPYAFVTKEGNLLSGISVKADSVEIKEGSNKY